MFRCILILASKSNAACEDVINPAAGHFNSLAYGPVLLKVLLSRLLCSWLNAFSDLSGHAIIEGLTFFGSFTFAHILQAVLQHVLAFNRLEFRYALVVWVISGPGDKIFVAKFRCHKFVTSAHAPFVHDILGMYVVCHSVSKHEVRDKLKEPVRDAPEEKHHRVDVAVACACGKATWSSREPELEGCEERGEHVQDQGAPRRKAAPEGEEPSITADIHAPWSEFNHGYKRVEEEIWHVTGGTPSEGTARQVLPEPGDRRLTI